MRDFRATIAAVYEATHMERRSLIPEISGPEKTLREVHVYRLNESGLIAEAWSYSSDQSKSDRGLLGGVLALVQDVPDS